MSQYTNFRNHFVATDSVTSQLSIEVLPSWARSYQGSEEFLLMAGTTFNRGIYRIFTVEQMIEWTAFITRLNDSYQNKILCFGCDWLGRLFVLTSEPKDEFILFLDPSTGEVLTIPCSLLDFHNTELVHHSDAALASDIFTDWHNLSQCDIKLHECVSYTTPLFLGGEDEIANMEISDMAVYWSVNMQILSQWGS